MESLTTEQLLIHAIPILESYDKVLIGSVERDAIMTGQSDIFFQMGLTNPELMAAGHKEFLSLFASMKSDMRDLVGEYMRAGALNNSAMARKLTPKYMSRFKQICGKHYNDMFLSGAKAVGNPYYRDLGQTRKDFAFLAKARRVEERFFRKLLGDIGNPEHMPRHPYLQRASYYGESGRAQYLNGMVGGAGKNVNIRWRLNMYGSPLTEHCDVCPILAKGLYTWETIPTIPRGGDTPCMYRCYCGIQIVPRKGPPRITVPGRGSQEGQYAPNRYGALYDAEGNLVMGTPLTEVERMYAEMYKARQMIQVKSGVERREWIMRRQAINRDLIDFIKVKGYRAVPSVSVRALIETVKSAQTKGGALTIFKKLGIGDEIVFVRANYSAVGILEMRGNKLVFVGSDGQTLIVDDVTDILFVTKKATPDLFDEKAIREKISLGERVGDARAEKLMQYLKESKTGFVKKDFERIWDIRIFKDAEFDYEFYGPLGKKISGEKVLGFYRPEQREIVYRSGTMYKDIVYHEIGHGVGFTIKYTKSVWWHKITNIWREVRAERYYIGGRKFIMGSHYVSHPDEFIAECFARYHRGYTIPPEIEVILKKWYGIK